MFLTMWKSKELKKYQSHILQDAHQQRCCHSQTQSTSMCVRCKLSSKAPLFISLFAEHYAGRAFISGKLVV